MRPSPRRRVVVLLVGVCIAVAAAGCGSDVGSETSNTPADAKPRPAVAERVVTADRYFGFPATARGAVRTNPADLSADLPGLYADPEKAVADLRHDGFVAGSARIFKSEAGPDVATQVVVQMRDAEGAKAESAREIDTLLHLPCPPAVKCEQKTRHFAVPGIPGATGINTTQTIRNQPGSVHPDVLRADAIVFRDGPFVEQVFLGTRRPTEHRRELINAALKLYRQGK